MIAALKEGVVEFVVFSGLRTTQYPGWFLREMKHGLYEDESRYTRYIPENERPPDYYDKTIVEDYSVFLRKEDGDIFCTTYDIFEELYYPLKNNPRTHSGVAAFKEDCIEYVEVIGGDMPAGYPEWFYDYFSDGIVIQSDEETILFYEDEREISITSPCVFLRNKFGQIAHMDYVDFERYYISENIGRHLGRIPY